VGERAGVRMDRQIQGESQGNPRGESQGGIPYGEIPLEKSYGVSSMGYPWENLTLWLF